MKPSSPLLTPSELIYLNAEQFLSSQPAHRKTRLLHMDREVSLVELAQMTLAGALLANEQAGTLRLELREKKSLFGMRSGPALFASASKEDHPWPAQTLEAVLPAFAARESSHDQASEVGKVVSAWIKVNQKDPFAEVLERMKAGLAGRGLLTVQEERRMKVFLTRTYHLPEETRALAASHPIEPVRRMLDECRETRPQIWETMFSQIKKALAARQEQNEVDFFDKL